MMGYGAGQGSNPYGPRRVPYTKKDGTDVKFLSKDFQGKLEADLELKDEIYNAICDAYILTYKPGDNIGIDDVEIDEEFVNEES